MISFLVKFQARKSDDDVNQICEMCDKLKVSQIVKILNLYTPADEYEERVTPAFVRKIQAKLSHRAMIENQEQVMLFYSLSSPWNVNFKTALDVNRLSTLYLLCMQLHLLHDTICKFTFLAYYIFLGVTTLTSFENE